MKVPDFYQPERVGELYTPRVGRAVAAGWGAGGGGERSDRKGTLLLLVDAQVDFIHANGALSVPGAVDDTRRTIEWIFRNLDELDAIAASLDSHSPQQIFFPTWWADPQGEHPQPYTVIVPEDVESGAWRPLFEPDWSRRYVQALRSQAKKDLMIWPFHTMIGTPGHVITPGLYEAMVYQAAASGRALRWIIKGTLPETEFYSLLEAEVKPDDGQRGQLNRDLLDWMIGFERVYIAGQAKSHCVLETLASIVGYLQRRPDEIAKFHVLEDCTSSVQHPQVDFEALAQEALAAFERQGLKRVTSETPLD